MDHEDRTLSSFLDAVASEEVAPAGGTAVAVVGAIGAALCEMACIHLVADGETPEAPPDADLVATGDELQRHRESLLALGDADAAVVDELFGGADGEGTGALERSVGVPLATAEVCLAVLESAATVTGAADRPVVADAGTGAVLARGALSAAVLTARGNLEGIDDDSFAAESERRAAELEAAGEAAFDRVAANLGWDR